ncbi:Nose resistant to fluoxetine protein 6 [Halotydeus destructor]|nr:Nose resistant to fluoxetine protein 6 [Halotydeus destructor]
MLLKRVLFWSIISWVLMVSVHCAFEDIFKLCEDEACEISEQSLVNLNSTAGYRKRMFKLISAGVPQILWEEVNAVRSKDGDMGQTFAISRACADSLVNVSLGLEEMNEWAYRFIDASGKTPSSFFGSATTSFGDYNECLDIHTPDFDGQYCMPDLFALKTKQKHATWPGPSRPERAATGQVSLGDIAVFKGMPFNFGLCVPSTCKAEEVRNVLNVLLGPYLLKPAGDINCDTKVSISYSTRFKNLTSLQVVAMLFIATIVTIVGLATSYQLTLMAFKSESADLPPLISAVSMVDNVKQLVRPQDYKDRNQILDICKFVFVVVGVFAHIVVCLEIPLSYLTYQSISFLNNIFGSTETQIFNSEASLNLIALLGGMTSFAVMIPLAKRNQLPFLPALLDRWVRFVPSVLCITAIEFIWPVLWSGPVFSRVADFTIKKCTETWWKNLIFINNWFPVIDICAAHTYSTAIDFQLFVLGLIATYLIVKSVKAGLAFSGLMIVYGWLHTGYNAHKYSITATLYVPDTVPMNIVNYMDYIHMSTPVYIPSYFMGYIVGHILSTGYRFQLNSLKDHLKWTTLANVLIMVVVVQNALYNGLKVIPLSWSPLLIIISRSFFTLAGAIYFVYFSSKGSSDTTTDENSNDQEKPTSSFDLMSTLCRLSYSIYLSNYVLIKSEFFGQKVLYPADVYLTVKRIFATTIMILLFSFVYHLFFIAPFNNVRRILFDRKPKAARASKTD